MIRLVVGDIFTRVVGNDWEAQKILYDALSYKKKGSEHIARHYGIEWDGIQSYYDTQNFHFLTGFLPKVLAALNAGAIQYEIEDTRTNPATPTAIPPWRESRCATTKSRPCRTCWSRSEGSRSLRQVLVRPKSQQPSQRPWEFPRSS